MQPASWRGKGGDFGTVTVVRGSCIIKQTDEKHRQIGLLLGAVRRK